MDNGHSEYGLKLEGKKNNTYYFLCLGKEWVCFWLPTKWATNAYVRGKLLQCVYLTLCDAMV